MSTASRVFAGLNILLLLGGAYLGLGVLNIYQSYATAVKTSRDNLARTLADVDAARNAGMDSDQPGVRALSVALHRTSHDRGGIWFVQGAGVTEPGSNIVRLSTVAVAPPEENRTLNPLTGVLPPEAPGAPPSATGAPFPTGVTAGMELHVFEHSMRRDPQDPTQIVGQSLRYLGPVRVAQVDAPRGVQATMLTTDEELRQILAKPNVPLLVAESLPADDPALYAGMTPEEFAALGIGANGQFSPQAFEALSRVGQPIAAGEQTPPAFIELEVDPLGEFAARVNDSGGDSTIRVMAAEFDFLRNQGLVDQTPKQEYYTRPVWNYAYELEALRRNQTAANQKLENLTRDRALLQDALDGVKAEGEFRQAQGASLEADVAAMQAEVVGLEAYVAEVEAQLSELQAQIEQLTARNARYVGQTAASESPAGPASSQARREAAPRRIAG